MCKFKIAVIVILASMILACGGGGGSDSGTTFVPTDPNQLFPLSKINSTTQGTVFNFAVTGSDSNGVTYTGTIAQANRALEMYSGVLTTPRDTLINLIGGGSSTAVTSTGYIDTSGNLVGIVVQTTGLICTPVAPNNLPATVKIGDFGILSALNCDDNTTQSQNWNITDAGSGNVNLVTNAAIRNQFNTILSTTRITYKINGSGDILSISVSTTILASGYTLAYGS